MTAPSGEQMVISRGTSRATITEVGAALREFVIDDREIVFGYPETEMCSGGRGQVLCPWPNRLEDGSFTFDDIIGTAALDEPQNHNAIHGLVRWMPWRVTEQFDHAVRLSCDLFPQPAYPYFLSITLTYEIDERGLTVTTQFGNGDTRRVPIGLGFHPYFLPGVSGVDGATVVLAAKTHVCVDERELPVGVETMEDFCRKKGIIASEFVLSGLMLDDCFTDLDRDEKGDWHVDLLDSDRTQLCSVWGDSSFSHVMCFTADTLDGTAHRRAVAIEPMTCAPNALRTGEHLIILEPSDAYECRWGITVAK